MRNIYTLIITLFFPIFLSGQVVSSKSPVIEFNSKQNNYPLIELSFPVKDSVKFDQGYFRTYESSITIKGKVTDNTSVEKLFINGNAVNIDAAGLFSFDTQLPELGNYKAEIIATDNEGNTSKKEVFLRRVKVEKRIALVIGNSDYTHVAKLRNPKNDAEDMAQLLRDLDFTVLEHTNLPLTEMTNAIRQFNRQVTDADIAIVYYSGHGMQVDNINYLIPVDASCQSKSDVKYETIEAELIMDILSENIASGLSILILDACRNNPFLTWQRGGGGLASMSPPSGTMVAYSTSPGKYASEGTGSNGLYTGQLIKQLQIPQRIEDVFINTRIAVEKISKGEQSPWELGRLRGEYYLK